MNKKDAIFNAWELRYGNYMMRENHLVSQPRVH